jgi:hypothetical protein
MLPLPGERSGMILAVNSGRQFLPSTWGRVRWLIKSANVVPNTFVFPRWRRRGRLRLDVLFVALSMVA